MLVERTYGALVIACDMAFFLSLLLVVASCLPTSGYAAMDSVYPLCCTLNENIFFFLFAPKQWRAVAELVPTVRCIAELASTLMFEQS